MCASKCVYAFILWMINGDDVQKCHFEVVAHNTFAISECNGCKMSCVLSLESLKGIYFVSPPFFFNFFFFSSTGGLKYIIYSFVWFGIHARWLIPAFSLSFTQLEKIGFSCLTGATIRLSHFANIYELWLFVVVTQWKCC